MHDVKWAVKKEDKKLFELKNVKTIFNFIILHTDVCFFYTTVC